MEIIIKHDRDMDLEERRACDEVDRRAFAEHEPNNMEWVEAPDWYVIVKDDGAVVSQLVIIDRIAQVEGEDIHLGGIGGVATLPEQRRRGFAGSAMLKAADFMRSVLGVDFGLLVTDTELISYYSRLGWQHVPGPLVIDQTQGKTPLDIVIMVLPCVRKDWPPGTIDLCGRPW